MIRSRLSLAWCCCLTTACAHVPVQAPATPVTAAPAETPADSAFHAALTELGAARIQSAGALFKAFAERFPSDPRAGTARLHQASAALASLDQVRGLDEAQAILAQLPADCDPAALQELRALILSRARALQAEAALSEVLSQCEGQSGEVLDRERSQAKAQIGKLQSEVQRRERTLTQVKQRLLEIQQLAAEMLGAPLPLQPQAPDDAESKPTLP